MRRKEKILVVDDEEIVRVKLGRVLTKEGFDVTLVKGGREALALMAKKPFDLMLSDMMMEDMDGLALLKEINKRYPSTIFIIITGHGTLTTAIESMRLGAFDYLLKPCDDVELVLRIQRGLKERRLQKKIEAQTRKLEQMAITDGLTGLFSRSHFMESLDREFKLFLRYKSPLSFMMIDIDYFKRINDEYGHQVGDKVLKNISNSFRRLIRETDIIGRYGGEEFGIIQPRTDPQGAITAASRILTAIREDPTLCRPGADKVHPVTVSIGVASCPHRSIRKPDQLIKAADTALYKAKHSGRNTVVDYCSTKMGSPSKISPPSERYGDEGAVP